MIDRHLYRSTDIDPLNNLTEEEKTAVLYTANGVLTQVKEKHILSIRENLELYLYEVPDLQEGDITIGTRIPKNLAKPFVDYLQILFGISSHTDEIGTEDYGLVWRNRKDVTGWYEFLPVSDWYMCWYIHTQQLDSKIKDFILNFHEKGDLVGDKLYRGESAQYPSVRSTLSRNLNTTNSKVIEIAKRESEQRILAHLKEEQDPLAVSQHLGGPTNSIDFSLSPWVALYFASDPTQVGVGVVWSLPKSQEMSGLDTRRAEPTEKIAQKRAKMQNGWLVESPTGVIERSSLEEVIEIPQCLKIDVRRFLNVVGIGGKTLNPDTLHQIEEEKSAPMSWEASMLIYFDYIRESKDKAKAVALSMVEYNKTEENRLNIRPRLYIQGIAYAVLDEKVRASSALGKLSQLFGSNPIPQVVLDNLDVVNRAIQTHRSIKPQDLNWEPDKAIWTQTFENYRFIDSSPPSNTLR